MSYISLLTHIVITTYKREMVINTEHSSILYKYLTGIVKNKCRKLVAINGIPNHIHLLVDMSPMVALSTLMKDMKYASALWMKKCELFPMFEKWAEGYYAASISYSHKQSVIDYIMNQQNHHKNLRFDDEYDRLLLKNGMSLYKYPE